MSEDLDFSKKVIYCPSCEFEFDEDYVCDVCGHIGGQGEINVLKWLKNNQDIFSKTSYNEVESRIIKATIDCPYCYAMEDEQYTCTMCWCTGGNGQINIFEYMKDNPLL